MAIVRKGETLSGTVGQVVLYEIYGKKAMRTLPTGVRKINSTKVKKAQSNFAFVMSLMQMFKEHITIGYGEAAYRRSAFQEAMSANLANYNNALREQKAEGLAWLTLSKGRLSGAGELHAELNIPNRLTIIWQDTQPDLAFRDDDIVMLSVATTDKAYSHVNTHAATRRDGIIELDLPAEAVGKELYAFITFKRAEGKGKIFTVSNSQGVMIGE
ncbi:MAG: DUF6266 family protein [Lentimicrobiaceae bacterium]